MRTFAKIAEEAKKICGCAYIGSGTRYVLDMLSVVDGTNPNETIDGVTVREMVNCLLDLTEYRWSGEEAERIKGELRQMLN